MRDSLLLGGVVVMPLLGGCVVLGEQAQGAAGIDSGVILCAGACRTGADALSAAVRAMSHMAVGRGWNV